jgi:hypothetical protein
LNERWKQDTHDLHLAAFEMRIAIEIDASGPQPRPPRRNAAARVLAPTMMTFMAADDRVHRPGFFSSPAVRLSYDGTVSRFV